MSFKVWKPIFILNAPKQVGKDTVAHFMREFDDTILTGSFKHPIFNIFYQVVPIEISESFEELYETPGWKDTPNPLLNNKTPRELLIHISENFIKPFFGDNYYGKSLADHIWESENLLESDHTWVIPDGGFYEEIEEVHKMFPGRIVVVHITRPGFTEFTEDSRSFVTHPGVHTIEATNADSSEALALRLMGYIDYE